MQLQPSLGHAKTRRANATMELGEQLRRRLSAGLGAGFTEAGAGLDLCLDPPPLAQFAVTRELPNYRTPLRRFVQRSRDTIGRGSLLATVSALSLLAYALPAHAVCIGPCSTAGAAAGAVGRAMSSAISSVQQAALVAQQSASSLTRATLAVQAMQAAQIAARQAALAGANNLGADPNHPGLQLPNVPDGLASGGLVPDSGLAGPGQANAVSTWVGANTPIQTSNGQSIVVSIDQTQPNALLNWTTFNVGKNTTVVFDQQGNTSWVALNRIADPSGVPSQILGHIRGDGQILLINQNGIIFGGSSQVNVHTLIASSEDIDESNATFLNNGLFSDTNPSANSVNFNVGTTGAITVQAGAIIDTTQNLDASGDGGYVALIGTTGVSNAGTIMTQAGQTILAGGSTSFTEPSSSAVGVATALTVVAGGAPATNAANGLLIANDGALTISGSAISNFGGIEATTSVTRPGSIMMSSAGNVTLASGSLLAILPDETSGPVPIGTVTPSYFQSNLQPQINISAGNSVDIQSGAFVKAPSAAMTVTAGTGEGLGAEGTVLFEPGSVIDLSGLAGVTLPMSINQVSILITANEVADDPLARSLISQTITIDARLSGTNANGVQWVGSPILDASGYVGLIGEPIDQVLTAGGSINVGAQNFIQQPGSLINVSGGYVTYQGGTITTTELIGSDGRIYNIGNFPANIAVVGIAGQFTVDHAHWNVTDVYTNGLISGAQYNPTYIAGASAGAVNVTAYVPVLQGSVVGDIEVGSRQAAAAIGGGTTVQTSLSQLPQEASLSVAFANPSGAGSFNPYNVIVEPQADAGADPYGLVAGNFSFANAANWTPVLNNGAFPIFSDLLTSYGLGAVSIKGANELGVTADATVSVLPGGSIIFNNVTSIAGTLNAPGGSISLTGFTYTSQIPQQAPTPAVVIAPTAVLNVRGQWVNDTGFNSDQQQGPAFINGGSVSITTLAGSNGPLEFGGTFTDTTQSIVLSPGSVIDVSSGGYVGPAGKLATGSDGLPKGKAGSVKLTTYSGGWAQFDAQGVNPSDVFPQLANGTATDPTEANVVLGGTIYAYGFDGGGTFSLQAPTITIDGGTSAVTSITSGPNAGTIVLPPSFFQSGFSQYTLTSTYGSVIVTPGTQLVLSEPVLQATGNESVVPTGAIARSFESVALAPAFLRPAASLTLAQDAYVPANLPTNDPAASAGVLLGLGAGISTDPGGTINLVGAGPVTVLGDIIAPGGAINLVNNAGLSSFANTPQKAAEDVWIGSDAVLDVYGVYIPKPLGSTFSFGTLLNGGTITVVADSPTTGALPADMVVQPGAQFLLGGVAVNVNLRAGALGAAAGSQLIWSNGGVLQLTASGVAANNSIYFAGTVDARGGVDPITGNVIAPLASGGTLSIGNFPLPSSVSSYVTLGTGSAGLVAGPSQIVIEPAGGVAANLPATAAGSFPKTQTQLSALTPSVFGGYIGVDTLDNSGFDSVNLNSTGSIAFNGSSTIVVPGALTLLTTSGSFVLLPSSPTLLPAGVTNPANYTPPACAPAGACVPAIGAPTVALQAGYVEMVGRTSSGLGGTLKTPTLADGTLNILAQWIDLERAIALNDVLNANFTSSGAIRFLPDNYGFLGGLGSTSQTQFAGMLFAPGNLTLGAAEIYPVSNTQFLLESLGAIAGVDNTLAINQTGSAVGPLSAGGTIILDAANIQQNGTLWAPLGSIVIGLQTASQIPTQLSLVYGNSTTYTGPLTVTQNVTLGANSLTSVSANGLDIPDGYTVDGTSWYQGTGDNNNPGDVATQLTAPPAKSIGIFAASITTGGRLDASGGGDIYAVEFVAGTGGNRNVLTTYEQSLPSQTGTAGSNLTFPSYSAQYANGQQVYALVPSYEAPIAAYDPGFADYPFYSGDTIPTGTALINTSNRNAILPGTAITITGGNGIAAGTYTLLPGMYATLPGAYRVVQVGSNVVSAPISTTTADGSLIVSGYTSNALTGGRSSQLALFQIQSNAVWSQYSQINITSGTSFFRSQALAAGTAVPPLPIDGGQLVLAATNTLNLGSSNSFTGGTSNLAPGLTGGGGQVDIAASNILILAPDQSEPAQDLNATTPYLVLDADQISALGVPSVLIGGSATFISGQETITANALNLEVDTDAAHPLTAPDLILVSKAGGNGITVDAGSVIEAVGTASPNAGGALTIGSTSVSGDGSLLRVSNGAPIAITRLDLPATTTGAIAIGTAAGTANLVAGADVMIAGASITADSSGSNKFAPDLTNPDGSVKTPGVVLRAQNYTLSGGLINIGGGSSGLVLSTSLIDSLAGANSLTLRSGSVINFFDANGLDIGDGQNPIGTLTFDAAGLFSQGGTTTINAGNFVFTDSQATPNNAGGLTGTGGTLNIIANGSIIESSGAVVFGIDTGNANTSLSSFASVNLNAGQAIQYSNTGSLDAVAANVQLTAPEILVNASASQSFTTLGTLMIMQGEGTEPVNPATNFGGALTLTASGITDSGIITALSGNVKLNATAGNILLEPGASIYAGGSQLTLLDVTEDTPGGSVTLTASNNITVAQGADISVAGTGLGYAGSLSMTATGTTTLAGTLDGSAAFKDLGGNLSVQTGFLVGNLELEGFGGSVAVTVLGQGANLVIPAATVLSSDNVLLVANNGSVIVNGTIDASSYSGGTIALYGAGSSNTVTDINTNVTYTNVTGGVSIGSTAQLLACYISCNPAEQVPNVNDPGYANGEATLVQTGGTITLGTTGVPNTTSDPNGALNASFGYENVDAAHIITTSTGQQTINGSGSIAIALGAVLDVAGGPGGANVNNAGGQVIVRAPLLDNNNVNVSFNGTVIGTTGGPNSGVALDAYAVWSTTDNGGTLSATHFDGVIDPAGWYQNSSTTALVAGTLVNPQYLTLSTGGGTSETGGTTGHGLYVVVPTVSISGGGGSGAQAKLTDGLTTVTAARGLVAGAGYTSGPNAVVAGTYSCSALVCKLTSGGTTYFLTLVPNAALTGATTGSGLTVSSVTISATGTVSAVADSSVGSNYNGSIGYSIFIGQGTNLSAPAQLATATFYATVTGVSMASAGSIYASLPNITLSGGQLASGIANLTGVGISATPNTGTAPAGDIQFGGFTPTAANPNHTGFYQTTLVGFVENPFQGNWSGVAADFGSLTLSQNLHLRPEVDLVSPSNGAGSNGGNITVVSNWDLGASCSINVACGSTAGAPLYRTGSTGGNPDAGEPGVLGLFAANNVAINATVSDGFAETVDAFGGSNLVANSVANNPQVSGSVFDYNTTSAANLMSIISGVNDGSFSYNFVAGSNLAGSISTGISLAVDPDALVPIPSTVSAINPIDSVTVNNHSTYGDAASNLIKAIDIPTLVRTGTGSITIAAAGNVELLDTVAPGAIYTAGAVTATPSDFFAPAVPATYTATPNGLVTTPGWAINGGSVNISAGQSIIGIETPIDPAGVETGITAGPTGQFWSDWYEHFGSSNGTVTPYQACATAGSAACQASAWINYATFFQGIGALGGGNITLTAGSNITDIGASLPETIVVSGGFTGDLPVEHVYGGGNLLVRAGGNLLSSDFLVGRGAGLIQVGGVVQADTGNPITGLPTLGDLESGSNVSSTFSLPLLLAVQDGFVTVAGRGSVTLGDIFDPGSILNDNAIRTPLAALPGATSVGNPDWSDFFTTYGPASGVALTSMLGNVTAVTFLVANGKNLFDQDTNNVAVTQTNGSGNMLGLMLPATLEAIANSGSISIDVTNNTNDNLLPYPTQTGSDTGTIQFIAAQSINIAGLAMPQLNTSAVQYLGNVSNSVGSLSSYISPLGIPLANLAVPLHANDPDPVIITAGQNITTSNIVNAGGALQVIKPAEIDAGGNIQIGFIGQNNNVTDITSFIAGNNMQGGFYELYGPGTLLLEAGGNMGNVNATTPWGGVFAVGNGSSIKGSPAPAPFPAVVPYLPAQGATIDMLFGIGPGINYQGAINAYVNPANAGAGGIDFRPSIAQQLDVLLDQQFNFMVSTSGNTLNLAQFAQLDQMLASAGLKPISLADFVLLGTLVQEARDNRLGPTQLAQLNQLNVDLAAAGLPAVTPAELPSGKFPGFNLTSGQTVALFDSLTTAGQDLLVNRAFLDVLTEVATDYHNASSPYYQQYARAYAAIETLFPASFGYTNNTTGVGNGAAATIKTGNLDIARSVVETQMGGDINILGPGGGITVGSTSRDALNPSQEGILTLGGGNINVFTDGSVLVNQSRIMTEQGGDIDIFSANGDISAGEGPKTYVSDPPISLICDVNGYCHVNPSGLVSGAGIAAVITLPGQDPTKSNAVLTAPHGTVDAGAAGIRVAGNLILSPRVLNAYNIQTQGTVIGLPTFTGPNTAALTTANNTAGANQALAPPANTKNDQPSIIIVQFVGFGGDSGDDNGEGQRKDNGQHSELQDPNSAVQVLGAGDLSAQAQQYLTADEREKLKLH